jgi:hypothetical protein
MLPPALPPEGGGRRGVFREELFDGGVQQNMNFLATVDLVNAIVLEQSCDTLSADRILLARLVDLEEKEKAKEKWDQVRDLGNSLRQPTRLYLADESAFGFPKRYVDLGAKFTLARDDLLHFIQAGNRKAILDQKCLIYLQHRLSVLLSRIARDDIDWLSLDDLNTKIEVLKEEAGRRLRQIDGREADLIKAADEEKREELRDVITAHKEKLAETTYELDVAGAARDAVLRA